MSFREDGVELSGEAVWEEREGAFAEPPEPETVGAFAGDIGGLTMDQRLCLVALLKHTYISANRHPSLWQTLVEDEVILRGRLNDLFLDLAVDYDREVAYKLQVREVDGLATVPTLLRANPYTREETALLIFLRSRYTGARAEGLEVVHVDREDLHRWVEELRPADSTDISGDQKKTEAAIRSLCSSHILIGQQDTATFRISPVIESLLPVTELQSLLAWFREQNSSQTGEAGPEPESETGATDD